MKISLPRIHSSIFPLVLTALSIQAATRKCEDDFGLSKDKKQMNAPTSSSNHKKIEIKD